jgi:hypothetical protein
LYFFAQVKTLIRVTANTYNGFYTGNNNSYSVNNWNGYGSASNYLLGSFGGGIGSYGYYSNYFPASIYTYYPSYYSDYYSSYRPSAYYFSYIPSYYESSFAKPKSYSESSAEPSTYSESSSASDSYFESSKEISYEE